MRWLTPSAGTVSPGEVAQAANGRQEALARPSRPFRCSRRGMVVMFSPMAHHCVRREKPMRSFAWLAALIVALAGFRAAAQDKPDEILSAVVGVQARIQPHARSAATLGSQRRGTGVLIRDGLILTIGYLVVEAESVLVTAAEGRVVPATVAAYDHASGVALLRVVGTLEG